MYVVRRTIIVELVCTAEVMSSGSRIKFLLSVDSMLPIPCLKITGENDIWELNNTIVAPVTFDEKFWYEKDILFPRRGVFDIGVFQIEGTDIFDMFRLSGKINLDKKIRIYPAVYGIRKYSTGGKDIFQEITDQNSVIENPYLINDIRKYHNGDSLKKVHWKLSAKCMQLLSKNNENTTGRGYSIIVDMNSSNYRYDLTGATEELAVDGLVSLIYKIFDTSVSIKIFLNKQHHQHHEIVSKNSMKEFIEHLVISKSDGDEDFPSFIAKKIKKTEKINHITVITVSVNRVLAGKLIDFRSTGYGFTLFYCVADKTAESSIRRLEKHGIRCHNLKVILERREENAVV